MEKFVTYRKLKLNWASCIFIWYPTPGFRSEWVAKACVEWLVQLASASYCASPWMNPGRSGCPPPPLCNHCRSRLMSHDEQISLLRPWKRCRCLLRQGLRIFWKPADYDAVAMVSSLAGTGGQMLCFSWDSFSLFPGLLSFRIMNVLGILRLFHPR